MEQWKEIAGFPDYAVSNYGRIRSYKTDRILALSENQFGVLNVGLMRDGQQYHRSVPLLVAKAFIPHPAGPFDTPINLNGDRRDNRVENLTWRPRWFAVKYNRQFRHPPEQRLQGPIEDVKTGEISNGSYDCATRYGLLEDEVVFSIMHRTYVWPTYQEFQLL